ncbi:MAG: hypothetical protein AB7Y46_00190 [Armatimonadota bacterium]
MRALRLVVLGVCAGILLLAVLAAGWRWLGPELLGSRMARRLAPAEYERWARQRFEERFPGSRPLNWRIAEAAERFHRERPMGRFVLHENDCSDYIGCIIDEALGPGARFRRHSADHALCGEGGALPGWLFETRSLAQVDAVQPGDVIGVRHSPWYSPHEGSIGHVGVVGSDGHVLDFTKLRSWPQARYGHSEFAWFIRHNTPDEVRVGRLRPEFRYRVIEIQARP